MGENAGYTRQPYPIDFSHPCPKSARGLISYISRATAAWIIFAVASPAVLAIWALKASNFSPVV